MAIAEPKNDSTDSATKTAITMTAGGLGGAAGTSLAHTAGAILAGKASGTALGALAVKGVVGKGALVALAAHPVGLAAVGAAAGIWGAYTLCKKIFD